MTGIKKKLIFKIFSICIFNCFFYVTCVCSFIIWLKVLPGIFFLFNVRLFLRIIPVNKLYYIKILSFSISSREPFFCRHMNGADEVLLAIPSDVASKVWGNDKTPKNVIIQTQDGRKFNVSISEAKGKHIFFHGWVNVVKHLQLQKGCLVLFNPVDKSIFKVTHFIDGVFQSSFWTSQLSTTSNFVVSLFFLSYY
ncbi:putative transcription factor B3-Domain family [Helianthus debilis subsp. tardiflorus]